MTGDQLMIYDRPVCLMKKEAPFAPLPRRTAEPLACMRDANAYARVAMAFRSGEIQDETKHESMRERKFRSRFGGRGSDMPISTIFRPSIHPYTKVEALL